MKQIEVVQTDRWSKGPLGLVFVPINWDSRGKEDSDRLHLALHDWNQCYAAGHLRPADTFDAETHAASFAPSTDLVGAPSDTRLWMLYLWAVLFLSDIPLGAGGIRTLTYTLVTRLRSNNRWSGP